MELVFATNNNYKLSEVVPLLDNRFELLSLEDVNCQEDIPEDHDTLEKNASQKACYIYNKYKKSCFADDTGLEIDALDGKPGVWSARYAGPNRSAQDNMRKVLKELDGENNRKARFRTVISLIWKGKEYQFEGVVDGTIITQQKGGEGFGYDPIFVPENYQETFAEMELSVKNKISHRSRAIKELVKFLNKHI